MKGFFKKFLTFILVLVVIGSCFFLWAQDKYIVPILMYHNVDHCDRPKSNTVSPESFTKQMAYIKQHGYHVITLDEWVTSIKQKEALPPMSVVITFDDGLADNYTQAFPILKQYQFPATIFVITDVVGKPGFLTWDQIKEMEKSGISFGSHTRIHPYLPAIDSAEQRNQIQISKEILEVQLGHRIDYFAYPSGGFNDSIQALIKASGYKGACTTNRGYHRGNDDPYEIKRIHFGDNDNFDFVLWAKLSGYYHIFRKWKNPE